MQTYQVAIPTSGWQREKIEEGAHWQGNLAAPTVLVEQDISEGKRLAVTLVETKVGVEVADAEIWEWQAEEQGGYWVPGRQVPARQIELK